MLRQIHGKLDERKSRVSVAEASYPAPFVSGLEFNAPVHGTWNIIHTGMLVPQSHQIYACAINCNRGVVMTAAEMGRMDRFSTITLEERNIVYGDLERLLIDGVSDIIERLEERPRMVLVSPSCVQHFIGTNMEYVYQELERRYPDVDFAHCWMDPTMKRHALTPEQRLRRELYAGLKLREKNPKSVNIIGNNLVVDGECELLEVLKLAGCTCRELARCRTYEEYLEQSESYLNLVTHPIALKAAEALEKRLGMKYLYLPLCYGYGEIVDCLRSLAEELGITLHDSYFQKKMADCEEKLAHAQEVIGDRSIAIDFTFTPRPLGLARLLLEHGFSVRQVYLDVISAEEEADFQWLKVHAPELMLVATVHYQMRFEEKCGEDSYLALGQKAAYFTGTGFFVNSIEGDGLYGFTGIGKLAGQMEEALMEKKDTRAIVQRKGLGGACVLCGR